MTRPNWPCYYRNLLMEELSSKEREKASQCPYCGARIEPEAGSCGACHQWSDLETRLAAKSSKTEPEDAPSKTDPEDPPSKTEPEDAPSMTEPEDAPSKTEPEDGDSVDGFAYDPLFGKAPSRYVLLVAAVLHLFSAIYLVEIVRIELDHSLHTKEHMRVTSMIHTHVKHEREVETVKRMREAFPQAVARDLVIAILLMGCFILTFWRPFTASVLGPALFFVTHIVFLLLLPDSVDLIAKAAPLSVGISGLVSAMLFIWGIIVVFRILQSRRHKRFKEQESKNPLW